MDKIKKEADKLKDMDEEADDYEDQTQKLHTAIQEPIDNKSLTGWTSTGHTGEDVDIYAYGPGSEKFHGNIDNTDNAKFIFDFFEEDVED